MDRPGKLLHYPNMNSAVPTYALYGEQGAVEPHDWLHWETIQSRSRPHGYMIAPHRHEAFFQVLHLTGGGGQVTLDGEQVELVPPVIVMVPASTVHGYQFSTDVEGVVLTLMERDLLDGAERLAAGVITGEVGGVAEAIGRLLAEAERPGARHDRAMRAHVTLLQVALHRASIGTLPAESGAARARHHAEAFRRLVDERFRDTRRIGDYAKALGISQTHLNRVCRSVFGIPALAVIERRIALEARRQLLFSTLTVKQIGAALGYDDPAYFTRFLKRVLGTAPATFRRQRS